MNSSRAQGTFSPPLSRAMMAMLLVAILPWLVLVDQLRLYWTIDPTYAYGWIVPFLALYLFTRRWPTRPGPAPDRRGILLLAAAAAVFAPVRLVQEATPDWSVVNWALTISTVLFSLGMLMRGGGIAWVKHFAFPVCFIFVAVPWPNRFEHAVIDSLMRHVAAITGESLNWIGIVAWQRGNLIEIPNGVIDIDEACSGVRSMQAMIMVSLFLGELYSLSRRARAACVAVGLCIALVFNCVRTFLLSVIAVRSGISEISKWHDPAGFAILAASLVTLWVLINIFRQKKPFVPDPPVNGAFGMLSPKLSIAFLAWFIVTGIGTEMWYRSHEKNLPARAAWSVRWPRDKKQFRNIPIPETTRKTLLANEGQAASWKEDDGTLWLLYAFKWYPGRTSTQSARMHRPDTCLQANGAVMQSDLGLRVMSVHGVEFPFHAYIFNRRDTVMYVFFCIVEDRNSDRGESNLLQDWSGSSRLQRVLAGERNLGQQSLEFAVACYPDQAAAEAAFRKQLEGIIDVDNPLAK